MTDPNQQPNDVSAPNEPENPAELPTGEGIDAPRDETFVDEGSPVEAAQAAPGGLGGDEPTIGTGTSMALGCVAGTIFLILIGLVYLAIVTFLR